MQLGLAASCRTVAVPAAMAAYTSPKLTITQTATGTIVKASLDPTDDPTAAVLIVAPSGTQLTTNQAPGTRARPREGDREGAGPRRRRPSARGPAGRRSARSGSAATQAACIGAATPLATWVMVLDSGRSDARKCRRISSRRGHALRAIGPAYDRALPAAAGRSRGTPGRATFGAKVYSAELCDQRRLQAGSDRRLDLHLGAVHAGRGQGESPRAMASPAAIAPGARQPGSEAVRARSETLAGAVTQAGQARGGASVTIYGGRKATGLKRLGKAKVAANGQVRVQGQGRDVLPRRRGRSGRVGTFGVRDALSRCSAASRA